MPDVGVVAPAQHIRGQLMTEGTEAANAADNELQADGDVQGAGKEDSEEERRILVASENRFCAHCDIVLSECHCYAEDTSPRPAVDIVLKNLATPAQDGDGVADLVKRWALCVEAHERMRMYDALRWHKDCVEPFVHATIEMGNRMVDIVTEYTERLPEDERLALFGQALGVVDPEDVAEAAVAVADEVRAACGAFLRGDWNCVTKLGAVLLSNAFQSSDPDAVCMSDTNLRALYGGIDMLSEVLALGFSAKGWRFAIENDRAPLMRDGDAAVAAASVRDRVRAEMAKQRKAAASTSKRAAPARVGASDDEGRERYCGDEVNGHGGSEADGQGTADAARSEEIAESATGEGGEPSTMPGEAERIVATLS